MVKPDQSNLERRPPDTPAATDTLAPQPDTIAPPPTDPVQTIWGENLDALAQPGMTLRPPDTNPLRDLFPDAPPAPTRPPDLARCGYELRELLGQGGVGLVYGAVQTSIGREIAVKLIKPDVAGSPAERNKFVTEATVTGRLDHPNIVPIHDLGTMDDGTPFYAMKRVRGTPWSAVIDDAPLEENLRILLAVCDAMSFAHVRGVLHRDLKPDNVMLGEFGEVQVMDWGLGMTLADDGVHASATGRAAAGGTPAYMAPEMVTGEDGPVGTFSDVYLLGGLLYRMTCGCPPHPGRTPLKALQHARDNVITPPAQQGVLVDIALRALRTEPARRYASVRAFRDALLEYQQHAESIRLCERGAETAETAQRKRSYELFAQALFSMREALDRWPGNTEAQLGQAEFRLRYARCAFENGDFDLALSLLNPDDPRHAPLHAQVTAARRRRAAARIRARWLRGIAIAATAAVIITLTVASIWISAAKRRAEQAHAAAVEAKESAVAARQRAVSAQQSEKQQRRRAESAAERARHEEARAVQALAELEQAYADLVAAQEEERKARARAEQSEKVASETRDELAKTGMLLDNSWWVFAPDEARRRQERAAAELGLPRELEVALPGDGALTFVVIPAGEFVMGSPPREEQRSADEHLHRVELSAPFLLAKTELTIAQWRALTGSAGAEEVDSRLPQVGLSPEDVQAALLPKLQQHAPAGFRFALPTEAQWEFACRAGTGTAYYAGNDAAALDGSAWYAANSTGSVRPVADLTPNAFGLYDMHGNVSEICRDTYVAEYYLECPVEDPLADVPGEFLVLRGGSVLNTAQHCRSAYRSNIYVANRYEFAGVRLALVPAGE